ncbi:MAG: hypothetical protein R3F14_10600 [Polyangiaceae bacterium]
MLADERVVRETMSSDAARKSKSGYEGEDEDATAALAKELKR